MSKYDSPLSGDVIDTRDLVKRETWLEEKRDAAAEALAEAEELTDPEKRQEALDAIEPLDDDEKAELKEIETLRSEVSGFNDGEGLVAESYFIAYAQELAEDIGAIGRDVQWPLMHIDWEAAADALKSDYTEVTYQGDTYLVRSC